MSSDLELEPENVNSQEVYTEVLADIDSPIYKEESIKFKARLISWCVFLLILFEIFVFEVIVLAFFRDGWIYMIIIASIKLTVVIANLILILVVLGVILMYRKVNPIQRVVNKVFLFLRIPIPRCSLDKNTV